MTSRLCWFIKRLRRSDLICFHEILKMTKSIKVNRDNKPYSMIRKFLVQDYNNSFITKF